MCIFSLISLFLLYFVNLISHYSFRIKIDSSSTLKDKSHIHNNKTYIFVVM